MIFLLKFGHLNVVSYKKNLLFFLFTCSKIHKCLLHFLSISFYFHLLWTMPMIIFMEFCFQNTCILLSRIRINRNFILNYERKFDGWNEFEKASHKILGMHIMDKYFERFSLKPSVSIQVNRINNNYVCLFKPQNRDRDIFFVCFKVNTFVFELF